MPTMSSKQVLRKKISIGKKIAKLHDELIALRDVCPHHSLKYRACGSTGSWDRDDYYWYDWRCTDCDKSWTTSQDYSLRSEMMKKYPHAKKIDKYDNPQEYNNFLVR